MTTLRSVLAATALATALATVGRAAASSSSAAVTVKTAYLKGAPVGVTVRGNPAIVSGMCSGFASTGIFTPCRTGRSRYAGTACAWRITSTGAGSSVVMSVTTLRAVVPAIRPDICGSLARFLRSEHGFRIVRLR